MMNVNCYYPVLFVWNGFDKVKKVVNSKAPYATIGEALDHAYYSDYPANQNTNIEPGYAYWNGLKWVAQTAEAYEESRMDDPDFMTRQDMCHAEANHRLDCESRGFY